jgi:hypothetical protein
LLCSPPPHVLIIVIVIVVVLVLVLVLILFLVTVIVADITIVIPKRIESRFIEFTATKLKKRTAKAN